MDKVIIENLEVYAYHGVHAEENVLGQKFLLSAVMYTDVRQAGMTGDLSRSIHYGEVCRLMTAFMKEHTYQLIETAAEMLARYLLLQFGNLHEVELTVKKPWAPVGLPLETVAVSIRRGWHTAYLSIGSNMGPRKELLEAAVRAIEENSDCTVTAVSDLIETRPYGGVEQDDFLNGAVRLNTLLSPEELLTFLQSLEARAGRERSVRWGPRTLDLDILLYDEEIINTKKLTVPHPDMHNREFVLRPMAQIGDWVQHPVLHKSMGQLLKELYRESV